MKILNLKVRKSTFDAIKSGKKKTFEKDMTPHNALKFIKNDGLYIEDDERGLGVPKDFEYMRVSYEYGGESVLVKIKSARTDFILTDEGEIIGEPVPGSDTDGWIFQTITYELGEVIER